MLKSKRSTIRMYKKQLAKEKDELDQIIKNKYELGKKVNILAFYKNSTTQEAFPIETCIS